VVVRGRGCWRRVEGARGGVCECLMLKSGLYVMFDAVSAMAFGVGIAGACWVGLQGVHHHLEALGIEALTRRRMMLKVVYFPFYSGSTDTSVVNRARRYTVIDMRMDGLELTCRRLIAGQ